MPESASPSFGQIVFNAMGAKGDSMGDSVRHLPCFTYAFSLARLLLTTIPNGKWHLMPVIVAIWVVQFCLVF